MSSDENTRYFGMVQAYGTVFSSPLGRQVFEDIARTCFMNKTTHVPGDPHQSAFHEGMRAAVLGVQRMVALAHDPSFTRDTISTEFATGEEGVYDA